MQIDVGAAIAELLYEHDSVNIPGLGGLVAKYKSAAIDQVQGKIHPPSKDLNFNNNLVVNDGLLVNLIKEKHQLSYGDALKAVEEYVKGIKEAIAKREIVVFPNVGRLYMDYEKNLQFLPDNTNFNTDVYGLPTVQFYPVLRADQAKEKVATTTTAPIEDVLDKDDLTIQISKWFQKYLPYIGGLAMVLISLGLYFALSSDPSASPNDNLKKVSDADHKINVSPSKVEDIEDEAEPDPSLDEESSDVVTLIPEDEDETDEGQPEKTKDSTPEINTEEPTSLPGAKVCKIVVGSFGSKRNVEKLVEKIFEAGFEPYTEKAGSLTRVGVQMTYDDASEPKAALRTIRKKFDENAKIVQQ